MLRWNYSIAERLRVICKCNSHVICVPFYIPDLWKPSCLQATVASLSLSQLLLQIVPHIFWLQTLNRPSSLFLPLINLTSPSSQSWSSSVAEFSTVVMSDLSKMDNSGKPSVSTYPSISEWHHFHEGNNCKLLWSGSHNWSASAHFPNSLFVRSLLECQLMVRVASFSHLCVRYAYIEPMHDCIGPGLLKVSRYN